LYQCGLSFYIFNRRRTGGFHLLLSPPIMASFSNGLLAVAILSLLASAAHAQLSPAFYAVTCPDLESVVRSVMAQVVGQDPRMGASVIRLFFHDCFVNGCDASVLLDDTPTMRGEKNAMGNMNSLRGYEIIDAIKSRVEASCRATVSCADIVALAARDSVSLLGGPSWTVLLGRRDARTASVDAANANLPPASDNISSLVTKFAAKGLDLRDLTALSGAHTVGAARCSSFRPHRLAQGLYHALTSLHSPHAFPQSADVSWADRNGRFDWAADATSARQSGADSNQNCPSAGGDDNLAPLDLQTPNRFDNEYYQKLVAKKGLLHSDQELFNNGTQDSLVRLYSVNAKAFARDFASAMVKMGAISPLTGTNGEIRLNCRNVN
ncbi:unnamed protein product, partial [Musa acuminata subsp. malaccensis]